MRLARAFSSARAVAARTPLYDFHVRNGGKMVEFAGVSLPVEYAGTSVSASHLFTRKAASLFDVSHMLQTHAEGPSAIAWMESIAPVHLRAMGDGSSALTVFLDDDGGILDDLVVTRVGPERLFVVSNAGRREHDARLMSESADRFGDGCRLRFETVEGRALIAVQGPEAVARLAALCPTLDLARLPFMASREAEVAGAPACRLTRCGYTGEDGFEVSCPAEGAERVCEELRARGVEPAGLGARDSLRLEAGLCLYGADIDPTVTPVEAGLLWLIPRARRTPGAFRGSDAVLRRIAEGPARKRTGLRIEEGPPARRGAAVTSPDGGAPVGAVTSGSPSPSLGGCVAMAYVDAALARPGVRLAVDVRGARVPAVVTAMPFVPARRHRNK